MGAGGWDGVNLLDPEVSRIIPEINRARYKSGLEHFLRTGESAILGRRVEVEAKLPSREGGVVPGKFGSL